MRLKYFGVLLIAIVLGSCTWSGVGGQKTNVVTDTLGYIYKNFKQRDADCGNKPDSTCTLMKLRYPLFIGQKLLNDTIKNKLVSMFSIDDKPDISIFGLAEHFFDFYKKNTKPGDTSGMVYNLDIDVSVLRQDSSLATLRIKGYTYLGGAHGGSEVSFINWDAKKRNKITLDDVLASGYQQKLREIAEKIFRRDEKLSDTASLADGYFFKDNKFALNNNFSITPLGIRFLYNEYEIKPYSAGTTDLFIPYQQIKPLLKPNTVISQYIK